VQVSRLWSPVTRWGDFRRRQLAALEESNRIAAEELEVSGLVAPNVRTPPTPDAAATGEGPAAGADGPAEGGPATEPTAAQPAPDAAAGVAGAA
jgi:hypothetical protein